MKKSELLKLIKEELQGYSPQIGKTKGLTPDTLNKILKKIADDTEDEVSEIDNPVDRITLDIPLFIRLLEYAKEDAKTDMDLHNVTENIIKLSGTGNTLTMANYDTIVKKQELNESRYSQFKKQTEVVKPSTQMHVAIKEIKKRLQEVNKIASYTKQLKTELSETNSVSYNKRTEAYLSQLMKETATLYQNLKQIKENGKGKNKNIVD